MQTRAPDRVRCPRHAKGFTMLELLVSLVILVMAFSVVWSTFSATIKAWERGSKLLDGLHSGDFAMEQLVSALRSTAFFSSAPEIYGFWLDSGGGRYPADEMSWVTSGTALITPDSELANGLYRVVVTIEDTPDGDPGLAVRAFPHMGESDSYDVDPWFLSSLVKGVRCRTYNAEEEFWEQEWEDTNAVPSLIELTLFMDPIEEYGRPVELTRLIEIPVAPAVTAAVLAVEGQDPTANVAREAGTEAQPRPGGTPPTAAPTAPAPGAPQ